MTRGMFATARGAILAGLLAVGLAACSDQKETAAVPPPQEVAEAVGHYCGMLLTEHPGPKGQIHLESMLAPVWFSSVRDAIAFMRLPEEPRDISVVYVNDMGRAKNWDQPEAGAWVEIGEAWFVIESNQLGGMGAAEAIPFGEEQQAQAFQAEHGGKVVRLDGIPDGYIFEAAADGQTSAVAADGNDAAAH